MTRNRLGLSGNHVTILGVTAILAVVSGTVWSVDAYTNVALQDPFNGRKAAIDTTRQLVVKDTRGGLDMLQSNYVRFWRSGSTTCSVVATPPAGKALVFKNLSVNTYSVSAPGSGKSVFFLVGASCSGTLVASFNPPAVGVQHAPFDPGLVVPDGQQLWAVVNSGVSAELYGSGYWIPGVWGPPSVPVSAAEGPVSSQKSRSALGNGG